MQGRTWGLRLLLLLGLELGSQEALPPACESQIYCHGELLRQVQMARLYQDDKQFVDMPLSSAPDQVLRHFRELAQAYNLSIPRQELQVFVQEHFRAVGQELQPWTPEDWRDSPQFLQKILDPKLQAWAGQLHQLWKKLGKKSWERMSRKHLMWTQQDTGTYFLRTQSLNRTLQKELLRRRRATSTSNSSPPP